MNKKIEVSISSETIRNILVIAACIFLIWKLSDIFILLITAIMIASALNPAVAWLHKKLSMTLSAAIIVICLILPLVYNILLDYIINVLFYIIVDFPVFIT